MLPKRPDLKIIITSATIDVEKFSQHFDQAPIIEVSGRTYPVEVIYRPMAEMETDDIYGGILAAIDEIQQWNNSVLHQESDILVFLSGEAEINEAMRQLNQVNIPHVEVLPLYAKLSIQQQNRVFQPHRGRRIILATNVAETSVTVPGIRYVIDTGYARISRYSVRHKIQRLPVEPISQASANQRKGRCGRISEGICIRLYSEDDFLNRPEFTEAEILRTNLAAVILQMLRSGLGEISSFPFVDKPDRRLISDGFQLLWELQAIDELSVSKRSSMPKLTTLGRCLAKLPLDPRLARMLLAAGKYGCGREVLIIISAMEVQEPRQYPVDKKQVAEQQHRQYWHSESDFMAYINLWDNYQKQRQFLSKNQLKQWCKQSFLSALRMYEWTDVHRQLTASSKSLSLTINTEPAPYDAIHQSLLTGLLGQVGVLDDESGEYTGARNRRFKIFPGSSQFKSQFKRKSKKPHRWIVAGQLVETRQLYAHQVAKIDFKWLLDSASHLIKRQFYEPHYHVKSGTVMAFERISLYGLVIVEKNRTAYTHIDPQQAREIFIRAALVEGRYALHPRIKHQLKKSRAGNKASTDHFFVHQQKLIDEIHDLETKSRRRDILVDDEVIYAFYQQRIPDTVNNISAFEHWRKQIEKEQPKLLFIDRERLMQHDANHVNEAQFPKALMLGDINLPLVYHFEPGHLDDGVSVQVPISLLHLIPDNPLQWLVPGLLREKLIAIVKALPKQWRKHFVPVPGFIDKVLAQFNKQFPMSSASVDQPLLSSLSEQLYQQTGVRVPEEVWQSIDIDDYYFMNIQLIDDCGECIDRGRNLALLRQRHRDNVQQKLQTAGNDFERENITRWDFETLPEIHHLNHNGATTIAYPVLVDNGDSVSLLLHDDPIEARYKSLIGVVRLALLSRRDTVKYLRKRLFKGNDLLLSQVNMGNRSQVVDDILLTAMRYTCFKAFSLPMDRGQFFQAVEEGRGQFVEIAETMADLLLTSLEKVVTIHRTIDQFNNPAIIDAAIADIRQQLAHLFYPGCLYETPYEWFSQFPRYLQAICLRLEKVASQIEKDNHYIDEIAMHWQRYTDRLKELGSAQCLQNKALVDYRWMIEELRISLFAQTIRTLKPVSTRRLNKYWLSC